MPFECEIDHRGKEWMARSDEFGHRLAGYRHEILVERDSLVRPDDRRTRTDPSIAIPDRSWNVWDLEAIGLALHELAPKPGKCLLEECLDVVRLKSSGCGFLHVAPDPFDVGEGHRFGGERRVLDCLPNLLADVGVDDHVDLRLNLRIFAVADRVDQEPTKFSSASLSIDINDDSNPSCRERPSAAARAAARSSITRCSRRFRRRASDW